MVGESAEKLDDVNNFFVPQTERAHQNGDIRMGLAARIVVADNFLERVETPVVHVRIRDGNIAERGCFEFAFVRFDVREKISPWVNGNGIKPCVMETVIGEVETAVAVKAIAPLTEEQICSALRRWADR